MQISVLDRPRLGEDIEHVGEAGVISHPLGVLRRDFLDALVLHRLRLRQFYHAAEDITEVVHEAGTPHPLPLAAHDIFIRPLIGFPGIAGNAHLTYRRGEIHLEAALPEIISSNRREISGRFLLPGAFGLHAAGRAELEDRLGDFTD